ncbi:MAG: hypothetical protein NT118_05830, partial [Lentisphaerae bacterium]|nr:hypothetical protein [Lentisphaerota bacterium]
QPFFCILQSALSVKNKCNTGILPVEFKYNFLYNIFMIAAKTTLVPTSMWMNLPIFRGSHRIQLLSF